jgi:universal stress protein F
MTVVAPAVRAILVALDESENAPLVLATAAMMARRFEAQLFLVRVLVVPPDLAPAAHTHPDGLEGWLDRDHRAELRALMQGEPGVRYGAPIVVPGDPWRQIIESATNSDVDLIVIGSHRHYGRIDRMLGTVAAKVVNHADRDVLVVNRRGASRESSS